MRSAHYNAVNFPRNTAEEAPRLKPFIKLAEQLGSFAGQVTESSLKSVKLLYEGHVAAMNTRALTSAAIARLLKPLLQDLHMGSPPTARRAPGISGDEATRHAEDDYETR